MLQEAFTNRGVVSHKKEPCHTGDGSFQNIYMNITKIHLQTCTKTYGAHENHQREDIPTTTSRDLDIPCPSSDQIPRIPKPPLKKFPQSSNEEAYNCNIVNELA